jgi:hypothetical protein
MEKVLYTKLGCACLEYQVRRMHAYSNFHLTYATLYVQVKMERASGMCNFIYNSFRTGTSQRTHFRSRPDGILSTAKLIMQLLLTTTEIGKGYALL